MTNPKSAIQDFSEHIAQTVEKGAREDLQNFTFDSKETPDTKDSDFLLIGRHDIGRGETVEVSASVQVIDMSEENFIARVDMSTDNARAIWEQVGGESASGTDKRTFMKVTKLTFCGKDVLAWLEERTGKKIHLYSPVTPLTSEEKELIDDETESSQLLRAPLYLSSANIPTKEEDDCIVIMRPPVNVAGLITFMHEVMHKVKNHGGVKEAEVKNQLIGLLASPAIIGETALVNSIHYAQTAIDGAREEEAWETTKDFLRIMVDPADFAPITPQAMDFLDHNVADLENLGLALTTAQARYWYANKRLQSFYHARMGTSKVTLSNAEYDGQNNVWWGTYDQELQKARELVKINSDPG